MPTTARSSGRSAGRSWKRSATVVSSSERAACVVHATSPQAAATRPASSTARAWAGERRGVGAGERATADQGAMRARC